MTKGKFSEIVKEMLIPSIEKTEEAINNPDACKISLELKSLVCNLEMELYNEYQNRRAEFKINFMRKGKRSRINRHKVAALFYVSFIFTIKKNNFFRGTKTSLKYLFAHNAAFNAAIGIIEAFIYFGEEKRGHSQAYQDYCSYVKKNGIVERGSKYKPYNIEEFISTYKKKEPSILLLTTVFHSIECYSKAKFEEAKKLV